MSQAESAAAANADTLITVIGQLVRDTRHGREVQIALDSSLEKELGLDSLARVELVLRLEKEFGVACPSRRWRPAKRRATCCASCCAASGTQPPIADRTRREPGAGARRARAHRCAGARR